MTDKELVVGIYKHMYYYYLGRVGKKSEITGAIVTPKMIMLIIQRILELGGKIPNESYEITWEEITEV